MILYILFFLVCFLMIAFIFFRKAYDNFFNERQVIEFLEKKENINDLVIFSNSKNVIYSIGTLLNNGSNVKLYFNKFTYDSLYKEDILHLYLLLNNYPNNFSVCISEIDYMYSFIYSINDNFYFLKDLNHFVYFNHLDFASKQSLKHKEMLLNRTYKILNKDNIKIFSNLNLSDFE